MDVEIKKLWLEALRSGEYKQAQGLLTDGEGFCCLGVLCDIHSKVTGDGDWHDYVDSPTTYIAGLYESSDVLPAEVAEWAGLGITSPHVRHGANSVAIAELNDLGYEFSKLADIIEDQL